MLLCSVTTSLCQTLEQEECDADRKMVDVNVNNADVVIGGIFNMRSSGSNGYGCGAPHPGNSSLQIFENFILASFTYIYYIYKQTYLFLIEENLFRFDRS